MQAQLEQLYPPYPEEKNHLPLVGWFESDQVRSFLNLLPVYGCTRVRRGQLDDSSRCLSGLVRPAAARCKI